MKKTLNTIITFFKVEMWQIRREDVSPLAYVCLMVLKRLVVTVKFFTTRSVTDLASALTYSTVLAIVPIVAALAFQNISRYGLEMPCRANHRQQRPLSALSIRILYTPRAACFSV